MINARALHTKFLRVFSIFMIVVLPACWFGDEKNSGPIVVSVLSKKHHDDCHIKGSIWIPIDEIVPYAQKNFSPDQEIIFYCNNYMCATSSFARKRLVDLGYKNVFVYEGGIAEWLQKGYPTVGPAQSGYLKREMKAPSDLEPFVLTAEQLKQKFEANKN